MIRTLLFFSLYLCLCCLLAPTSINAQQLHHANTDLPCVNKHYNILAHVAVDSTGREPLYSEADLNKMLLELNLFFEPICVSFDICEYNVLEDDYSLGIIRDQPLTQEQQLQELNTRFALRRRINIFFLDEIFNELCGASTFEGILTRDDASIYTEQECDALPQQIAHHLGHLFGLRDTYSFGDIELVDGSNCETAGDLLCDTPADPFGPVIATPEEQILIEDDLLETAFYSDCEFIYEVKDPNGEYFQPDMGNIMSAYPCKCGFTQDQYRLMVETILKSEIRHF